ncbi:superoxide dismutase [Calidifontibacillus oryziterrae]|uniref:superoxide dismutase n=1 Tax=Calidifontibacillus oryziterrae TaxID=1191699 RepID=UPI000314800A|nr:superoxide dismutase [Calidifontibacillus oryziterrae]
MAVHKDYQQYLLDVKKWFIQVDEVLRNYNVDEKTYEEWKTNMERCLKDIDAYLKEANAGEEILSVIEDQVRDIYEDVTSIQNVELEITRGNSVAVGIGEHKLPPLPYPYDALEPYISEQIMKLHHDKHHKSYVDGLNKSEKMMETARENNDFELLKHWEREAAFHGSGHYLHTIFWNNMKPNGGGRPKGQLLKQIEENFGGFDQFKSHFTEAANKVEGVGWAILVWSPRSHRLEILQSEKHQHYTQWDTIPLLVLDVWEHAYYLQYLNEKKQYVDQWWNVVNWNDVSNRFLEAKKIKWKPF